MKAAGMYQIGEAAERTGLSLRTIRYYEEMGLVIPSGRTTGGFRLYTDRDVERLELVKSLKVLDLPLDAWKALLDARDRLRSPRLSQRTREAAAAVLAEHVESAAEKRSKMFVRLEAASDAIRDLRAEVRRSRQERAPTRG